MAAELIGNEVHEDARPQGQQPMRRIHPLNWEPAAVPRVAMQQRPDAARGLASLPRSAPIIAPVPKAAIAHILAGVPMARMGGAREIAGATRVSHGWPGTVVTPGLREAGTAQRNAALYLGSDESSYVTGIELFVDGGSAQI
jgi:hypothetical protein